MARGCRSLIGRFGLAIGVLSTAAAIAANGASAATSAAATAPPPLSLDLAPANIASTYGSGSFGTWGVDQFGLPYYRYQADELTDPNARQEELGGATAAQHQVGNDNIKGMAFNDGYTEFWSQDRLSQWANLYQPQFDHYAGGFGWLKVGSQVASTLYLDNTDLERDFGVGYYRKQTALAGVDVTQTVYAPFGSDPVLLDDVTLHNTTAAPINASWFEYWDVNPVDVAPGRKQNIGIRSPNWNPASDTLSVQQVTAKLGDVAPLSVFAAALNTPVDGFDTSVPAFFGSGSRAVPAEVSADQLSDSIAPPSTPGEPGDTLFVLRSPVTLAPGATVTLHYVYGMAHRFQIAGLVSKYRAEANAFQVSSRAWAAWLPKADFGPLYRWVSRELEWDAYLLRSASVYEEVCGHYTITQGGYYQYGNGENIGFRSWLHYLLPMVYADPGLAREILRYAISLQPPGGGEFPYGTGQLCTLAREGTSDDLDFWLLLAAGEYGLGSRDTHFFDEQLPFYGTSQTASVWQHLKLAFRHQESLLGPNGDYVSGTTGDWSDFSTVFEGMTESTLVTAQLAYAYPQLAALADLRGDHAFAAQLRSAGARDLATVRRQWTGGGWYSRGYAGATQLGQGAIFEEPQPWAILAGAPNPTQAQTLVNNIRRYLDGVGAPADLHGPALTGSALTPAYNDPEVTERTTIGSGGAQNNSNYPGGSWFDPNGWITWALGELDGTVPGARGLAWSEYLRNTLATHATVFPDHWGGTISIDDSCWSWYSQHPEMCGDGLHPGFDGQNTEQPAWMVMDAIRLAGITPTQSGFLIAPHYPFSLFSLRLPDAGIASETDRLRGYFVTQQSGPLTLEVKVPAGVRSPTTWANGREVLHAFAGGYVGFTFATVAGRPADWAVTWPA